MTIELSVILPAYNEAGCIVEAVGDVLAHICSAVPRSEIVVIDDGSTDATPALLAELARQEPRLRVIRQGNAGHGAALRHGLASARGACLMLLDSDRQIRLDDFPTHWRLLHEADLVAIFGLRRPRHDPAHRLALTHAMRLVVRLALGTCPRDANVPYKILRRSAWDSAAPLIPPGSTIPSLLLAVLLMRRHPDRIREVTVTHLARRSGTTVLRMGRLARLCRAAMAEVLRLRHDIRGLAG